MSRPGTPKRSTRSQSRELDVLAVLSDGETGAGSTSSLSSTVLLSPSSGEKRQIVRKRPKTPKATTKKTRSEDVIDEEGEVKESVEVGNKAMEKLKKEGDDHRSDTARMMDDVPVSMQAGKGRIRLVRAIRAIANIIPLLPPLLLFVALLLAFVSPTPEKPFSRNVYVDENALQPGSASVEWNWGEVEYADGVSERIATVARQRSDVRAAFLTDELRRIGLTPFNQTYHYDVPTSKGGDRIEGINTYARWTSARGDGREAFVVSAAWKSGWDGAGDPDSLGDAPIGDQLPTQEGARSTYDRKELRRTNVRGIATALTIARHLTSFAHWSKDLIFVFSDGELDGMQAWTSGYFGRPQRNLYADELHGRGSLIWNALAIDYPSDSFSHIVLKHEGLDGQLPNMDVISALTHMIHRAGGIPVELPASSEHRWPHRPLGTMGDELEKHVFRSGNGVRKYLSGLWNSAYQFSTLSVGKPSGIHGLFHRYHVDAISIFAYPAKGPYGFWHMGRAVESFTRSMSNLLERLHHSHFFYLLTSPDRFIEVAKYLPIAVLFSASLLITGIALWLDEGKQAHRRQESLTTLILAAIDAEDAESGEMAHVNKGSSDALHGDVPLRFPTISQRAAKFVSMLVQRSARRGDLVGTAKIQTMTALLDIHGRPSIVALTTLVLCHAVGALAFVRLATAPIDCARDGIESCKPLRLTSAIVLAAVLFITVSVAKTSSSNFFTRLAQAETVLPPEVLPSVYRMRTFRARSIARSACALAMMEAGMFVLVLGIVNFSLAASLGALLSSTFCMAKFPTSDESMPRKEGVVTIERSVRDRSPASDDSDAVEGQLVAEKRPSTTFLKFGLLVQSLTFVALSPSFALPLLKVLQRILVKNVDAKLPSILLDSAVVDRLFDGVLWNYQVLSSIFLPIVCLTYIPILLVGATSTLLIILS